MDNKEKQNGFGGNIPAIIGRYESKYSVEGFREKIAKVAGKAGIKVIYSALLLYYALHSPHISTKDKSIIYGALGYFIFPIDLIHDYLPFAGYTDDFAALAWAVSKVIRNITPEVKQQAREKLYKWFPNASSALLDKIEN